MIMLINLLCYKIQTVDGIQKTAKLIQEKLYIRHYAMQDDIQ